MAGTGIKPLFEAIMTRFNSVPDGDTGRGLGLRRLERRLQPQRCYFAGRGDDGRRQDLHRHFRT